MNPSSREGFAQATAQALYTKWCNDLRELKTVSDPRIREWWVQDLQDLHDQAADLLGLDIVWGSAEHQLRLILSQSVKAWSIMAKATDNSNFI